MRIRTRKNLLKKNIVVTFLLLIPAISFFGFIGFGLSILDDLASLTLNLEPPNTNYFTPLDQITANQSYLDQMADKFDYLLEEWHIPTNISIDVTFTNESYNRITKFRAIMVPIMEICI